MTKSEVREIVDRFSDRYYSRDEVREFVCKSSINDIVDYIYDSSHALAEIKNGLLVERELTKYERRS